PNSCRNCGWYCAPSCASCGVIAEPALCACNGTAISAVEARLARASRRKRRRSIIAMSGSSEKSSGAAPGSRPTSCRETCEASAMFPSAPRGERIADREEAVLAQPSQLLRALAGERVELLADRRAERFGRDPRSAVRPAHRLG